MTFKSAGPGFLEQTSSVSGMEMCTYTLAMHADCLYHERYYVEKKN